MMKLPSEVSNTLFLGICVFAGGGLNQIVFSWKEGLVWLHTSAILF